MFGCLQKTHCVISYAVLSLWSCHAESSCVKLSGVIVIICGGAWSVHWDHISAVSQYLEKSVILGKHISRFLICLLCVLGLGLHQYKHVACTRSLQPVTAHWWSFSSASKRASSIFLFLSVYVKASLRCWSELLYVFDMCFTCVVIVSSVEPHCCNVSCGWEYIHYIRYSL